MYRLYEGDELRYIGKSRDAAVKWATLLISPAKWKG